ncbi:MAG: hypothetical protein HEP71_09665 [Roseivirga sp.]|nr:hypothetical protein [Roseivirga sp.]
MTVLTFPKGIYEQGCGIDSDEGTDKRLLYYFDGDCALCFGKVKTIERLAAEELGHVKLVFIARTSKTDMFRQNALNAKIISCIQIDSLGYFEQINPDKTYLDQMAVLDNENGILIEGNLINDLEVRSSFKKALK